MTFIKTVDDADAEGLVKQGYDATREIYGYVYETTRMLSLWPEALAVEARRYQTLMLDESALTRAQKEMIATAVSAKNSCEYCCAHHMASMISAGIEAGLAQTVRDDSTKTLFPVDPICILRSGGYQHKSGILNPCRIASTRNHEKLVAFKILQVVRVSGRRLQQRQTAGHCQRDPSLYISQNCRWSVLGPQVGPTQRGDQRPVPHPTHLAQQKLDPGPDHHAEPDGVGGEAVARQRVDGRDEGIPEQDDRDDQESIDHQVGLEVEGHRVVEGNQDRTHGEDRHDAEHSE